MKLEKMEAKVSSLRRNSTGNSGIPTEPKPIPNYLRVSIGSCHDFCKYGIKRDFQTKSPVAPKQQDQNVNVVQKERSGENYKEKEVLAPPKSGAVSVRGQSDELKSERFGTNTFSHQTPAKQTNKTLLKSSSNIRMSQNDAGKGMKTSNIRKKNSSLPLASSSSLGSSAKSRTNKSIPKINNFVKKSKTEKTSYENVPEKIIHVVEPKDEKRNKGHQKMDINLSRAAKSGRVMPKEKKDSSPTKLKFEREKVVELIIQNGNGAVSLEKSLRKLVCDGELIQKQNDDSIGGVLRRWAVTQEKRNPGLLNSVIEETASKLVQMRKSKVKALVGAFESVIQDSESLSTSKLF